MIMKKLNEKEIQKMANSIARKRGYGFASEIIFTNTDKPKVKKHTCYGYRKYTTGEYVSNSYRANFGWKNTYYQNAQTTVEIPLQFVDWNN